MIDKSSSKTDGDTLNLYLNDTNRKYTLQFQIQQKKALTRAGNREITHLKSDSKLESVSSLRARVNSDMAIFQTWFLEVELDFSKRVRPSTYVGWSPEDFVRPSCARFPLGDALPDGFGEAQADTEISSFSSLVLKKSIFVKK